MHITFVVQDVEFMFDISNSMELGQVTDLLGKFAQDTDREDRATGMMTPIPVRPLITSALLEKADKIVLGNDVVKSPGYNRIRSLVWDWSIKRYQFVGRVPQ